MANNLEQETGTLNEGSLLIGWEEDKKFTTPAVWMFEVPEGYKAVRFVKGEFEKTLDAGRYWLWGWRGLYQSASVVDIRKRTTDYQVKEQNLMTLDNIQMPEVDYTVIWKVIDPEKAITQMKSYKRFIREVSETRIKNVVGACKLKEVKSGVSSEEIVGPSTRFGWKNINDEYKVREESGTEIEELMITNYRIPKEISDQLAAEAIAIPVANAKRTQADADAYVKITLANAELESSQKLKEAARNLTDPEAMELRKLRTLERIAKDGKVPVMPIAADLFKNILK